MSLGSQGEKARFRWSVKSENLGRRLVGERRGDEGRWGPVGEVVR